MRIISWLFIFLAVSLMLIGTQMYEYDKERNIFDLTNNLQWNFTYTEKVYENISEELNYSLLQTGRISNVVYKFTDFVGYSFMELGKFFIEFGFNNPQYNFEFIWKVLKLWIYFLFISLLIPVIAPLVAIIYLSFVGIIKLIKFVIRGKEK